MFGTCNGCDGDGECKAGGFGGVGEEVGDICT